jgi:hypothetical protein
LSVAVRELGKLYIDLSKVDLRDFKSRETGALLWKKTTYKIDFSLEMVPEDDLGYMHFRVVTSGTILGEAMLQFGEEDEDKGILLQNLVIS